MPEQEVTLTNDVGLHARPAALFSKKAAGFSSEITVSKGDRSANAKSIMSVLKLDVKKGDGISISTEGDDADEALAELVKFIESQ
ncbi:MAG: HPr family phosphocarrier protein [Actinomycetota bacterium]|nr:HPr family phosphocarrier protein [Actinomycetota bacterium]